MEGDGTSTTLRDHLTDLLRGHFSGRRVIVAMDVLVASAAMASRLHELGVERTLLVAGNRGTGDLDLEVEEAALVLGTTGDSVMGGIRAFEAALDAPSDELRRAIDDLDPVGTAQVVAGLTSERSHLCGRPVFGNRSPAWAALEDKTIIDDLWDRIGVPRAPSKVVPAEADELGRAAAALDRGTGTAWVADNREGWHGGGDGLWWVRDATEVHAAAEGIARIADRVRVMPFLEGRPCSIHGWVIGSEVIASRPCETVMLRERDRPRLVYGGAAATTWCPSAADAAVIRDVARQVGRHLRDHLGYRGVFTVDGVLTEEGFRPTELNPRFGAALSTLGRGLDLPLYLLHGLSIQAPELPWPTGDLEEALASAPGYAAAHLLLDDDPPDPSRRIRLARREDGSWEVSDRREGAPERDDRPPAALVELGPGPTGSFLRVIFDGGAAGEPVAPRFAEVLPTIASHLDLDVPAVVAAPDVRPAGPTSDPAST